MSIGTSGTGRGSIRTYPLPPDGFDPRAASPLELRRYGLPQRPDPAVRPELAALWDEVFSPRLSYITPTFLPMEKLVPSLGSAVRPRPDLTATDLHWSGAVAHASTGETFDWVFGQWNVPYVDPGGQGPGPWVAYTWIGIDGNTDVTQIGTIQILSADLTTSCYAFFEWWSKSTTAYPSLPQPIPSLPVTFGDTICGLICMQSTTAADFSMINMTTGVAVAFGHIPLNAPGTTTSMENQAEWINERPGLNQLPAFSPITFTSAYAGHGLNFVVDGGTADTAVNMVENGTTVATTTLEPPTSIKIVYTGGQPPVLSGQLLAYADDGMPGNVSDPVAVGYGLYSQQGGPPWLDYKFLFAGPSASAGNRIYAVDQLGRLLSYTDDGTSGNVSDSVFVGSVGWVDYEFLFAGTNTIRQNRIYAVEQSPLGQLVSYADDMTDRVVVGSAGWLGFKFLFAGARTSGEPCIYAVNANGWLLSYTDNGMAGNVNVLDPNVVGSEEWPDYKFLFAGTNTAGENGIYAVDQPAGRLLFYTDDGTHGNVSDPKVVGFGGWLAFKFLFAGENYLPARNRIYAVPA